MGYKENFILALATASITTFLLGTFVYLKGKDKKLNIIFALYSFSISWWSGTQIGNVYGPSLETSWFWARIEQMGVVFIPTFFVHFVVTFLELKRKWLLRFCYTFSIIIALLSTTTSLVSPRAARKFGLINFGEPGALYGILVLFFVICVIYGIYKLYQAYLYSTGARRNQLKYLWISYVIGYLGGGANFFLVWDINIPILNPYGTYLAPIYVCIVAYTITRHQLMDIEVIIKKSLVFAGMFVFAFGVFVSITLLVSRLIGGSSIISLAISALIITIFLRPLEAWLVNATDKFLFQKKYEYKQILKAFIDEVIMVLNLDEVVNSTLKLLDQTLHPYASTIFILNKVEDKYQLYSSRGLENKDIVFTSESKLITFLKNTKDPAVIKQIDGIMGVSPQIAGEMAKLNAMVVLPLTLHSDLIGFISLGKKKSDEEYTKDDLDVLQDLARTESIAVGNAQLLQEAAQSERRAAIGTMAAGIYHEIGNPLNIINTKIQVFLTAIERGFYKDRTREDIIEECQDILNETMNQTNRIADITRRLANFAKPSKEFKPQLISVPEEIEETLAVISHDLELGKVKIEKRIESNLPQVLADKREMQQVFFNLIRNAAQAIEESGIITIKATAIWDDKVHIEIQDTGKGIAEDKKNRIFEPFFTTKGPKGGTGLGLSIVRQLVWRNKGEISFMSQVGVGTTFILEFPKGA